MLKDVRNCINLSHSSLLLLYVDCIPGYMSQRKLSSLQECCCSQCCSLVRWCLMCTGTCSSFVYWYLHWWTSQFFGYDAVLLGSLLLMLQGKILLRYTLWESKKSKLLGRIGCIVSGKSRFSNTCSLFSGVGRIVGLVEPWVLLVRAKEMEWNGGRREQ